jgi:hypothetical protein
VRDFSPSHVRSFQRQIPRFRLLTLVLSSVGEERRHSPQATPRTRDNSDPQCAIETAVLNGFAHVLGGDRLDRGEIGDGAGNFENAIVGPGAEV